MIFEYTPMPRGAHSRPLLDVQINSLLQRFSALVDTGSVNTIFDAWIAEFAG